MTEREKRDMDIQLHEIAIRDLVAGYEDRGDEGVVGCGGDEPVDGADGTSELRQTARDSSAPPETGRPVQKIASACLPVPSARRGLGIIRAHERIHSEKGAGTVFFVSRTDTGVGKTVCTGLLSRYLADGPPAAARGAVRPRRG